jgi:hypothetical protein
MPRDLTDLMERATSYAPPEIHAAGDITRLAAHRHRRRTASILAAASVAVIAVAGAAVGLTGDQRSRPEPSSDYQHDRTVDLAQAVPASSLPGYTLEPWTIPSVQRFGSGTQLLPTYQAVDSDGRLLVVDTPGGNPLQGPFRARLYDTPGGPAESLRAPASPGAVGSVRITWLPEFYGADHLLWRPSTGLPASQNGFHITDLQGGRDEFVPATFRVAGTSVVASANDVAGRSMWMRGEAHTSPKSGVTVSDLYRATFSGQITTVGTGVTVFDVGPGLAGWMTSRGQVFVQSATGAPPQRVRVPVDPGCRLTPARLSPGAFAVTSSAVALTELCGSGAKASERLLVFDLSGRELARVTGVTPFNLSFAGDSLLFQGNELLLRYDLVTGTLSQLNAPRMGRLLQEPRGAGSYVLWYDRSGGHVARITG